MVNHCLPKTVCQLEQKTLNVGSVRMHTISQTVINKYILYFKQEQLEEARYQIMKHCAQDRSNTTYLCGIISL